MFLSCKTKLLHTLLKCDIELYKTIKCKILLISQNRHIFLYAVSILALKQILQG